MAESSIDATITELQAYLVQINDGLAGFQFLSDGNTTQAEIHDPLELMVVEYEDQKKLTEEAIASLTALQGSDYPNVPQMESTTAVTTDLDNDLRQAGFARQQITQVEPQAAPARPEKRSPISFGASASQSP